MKERLSDSVHPTLITRDVLIKATMTMICYHIMTMNAQSMQRRSHQSMAKNWRKRMLLVVLHGALLVFLVHGTWYTVTMVYLVNSALVYLVNCALVR